MRCLETRTTPEGYKRRRYQETSGYRYTTIEVPMEVWKYINRQDLGNDRAAARQRVIERQSHRAQAFNLWRSGKKMTEIGRLLGRDRNTISRWIKEAQSP